MGFFNSLKTSNKKPHLKVYTRNRRKIGNSAGPSNQNRNVSLANNPALPLRLQQMGLGGEVPTNAHRGRQRGRYNSRDRDHRPEGGAKNRAYSMGFKKLEEMLKDDPDQLVIKLSNEKSGFSQLLKYPDLSTDFIVLIVKVTARMCQSDFQSNKASILTMICDNNFIKQLESFTLKLCLQEDHDKQRSMYYWMDSCSFWENVAVCCETVVNTIPTVACEILPNLLKVIIKALNDLGNLTENLAVFESLQTKIKLFREERMLRKNRKSGPSNLEMEPTDDFRTISLYPTISEVTTNEPVFLRENKIEGKYRDVDQYLDIHYRLLREDFVRPLRQGIHGYLTNNVAEKKNSKLKIHRGVRFVKPILTNGETGVMIQLVKKVKIKFENSRIFMFGSLICFTNDNFRSLHFAKIIDRKREYLEEGQMVVSMEKDFEFQYNVDYVMIECNVYFEPYYQVLSALQNVNENTFPMKKYLLDVDFEKELPNYLIGKRLKIKNVLVDVESDIGWPSSRLLNLNDTQYRAFKNALTQKLSVIQGPPGTGKTYLGLFIAKTLLLNKNLWNEDRRPMLVVCFTNHALDQFLRGLMSHTHSIVRIGGQSKDEDMRTFNIKHARSNYNRNRNVDQLLWQKRIEVQDSLNTLQMLHNLWDAAVSYNCIVNNSQFVEEIPELKNSWFSTVSAEEFQKWLFGGRTHEDRLQEELQHVVEQETGNRNEEDDSDNEFEDEIMPGDTDEHMIGVDDTFSIASSYTPDNMSVKQMEMHLKCLNNSLESIDDDCYAHALLTKKQTLLIEKEELQRNLNYLKMRLRQGQTGVLRGYQDQLNLDLGQPSRILPDGRWRLYFHWLSIYQNILWNKIQQQEKIYKELYKEYEEVRCIEDVAIMRNKLVVGMTTTSAARLQKSLRALKSPIVIVEEAAEILESHVVVSLTEHCQHLILIGDHQQLKPTTADFTIEKRYQLGISLFERLIRNGVHREVLEVQHRMRPEICSLIAPTIYPNLKNHESVMNFPSVRGVDRNLFFINHNHPEELSGDNSKKNLHEAQFLVRLAKYLIQNNYEPEDITILAAYSGQLFALLRERKNIQSLESVRITVLDNYQGEESKIILLSLVRNNNEGSIGFLHIENRICVALSRAKEGMYIMGNMDLLCSKSNIWVKIRETLSCQRGLGSALPLRCQNHPETVTEIKDIQDFVKVSEGGCSKICYDELLCGHICKKLCHTYDKSHQLYKCKDVCGRVLCSNDHKCEKMCSENCGDCQVPMLRILPCKHERFLPCSVKREKYLCEELVLTTLPCEHSVNKPCHRDPTTFPCPVPCKARVDKCGHTCNLFCHIRKDPDHIRYKCMKPCARFNKGCTTNKETHRCPNLCYEKCSPCPIVVRKLRTVCSHVFDVACSVDVDTITCTKPCKKTLPCGHKCKNSCDKECSKCKEIVEKEIPACGHKIKIACSKEPTEDMCKMRCTKILPCGHPCDKKCCEACIKMCKVPVKNDKIGACGHKFDIPCYASNSDISSDLQLVKHCKEPCGVVLECDHRCVGNCGDCYQGRIHVTCAENCKRNLVCGHECKTPCREACQPCKEKCTYKCIHNKCNKNCGEPCTPCSEKCPRQCKHVSCKALCGERCTVKPCTEPCAKRLNCGHKCIGFCGDPCPPLCLVCNNKELTEEFMLGFEDEDDARFVLLDECKHVIESTGLQMWLNSDNSNEIKVVRCPRCNAPLTSTRRFKDEILTSIENITKVKVKFIGEKASNEQKSGNLLEKLSKIYGKYIRNRKGAEVAEVLSKSLSPVYKDRRQFINTVSLQIIGSKVQLFEQICSLIDKYELAQNDDKCNSYVEFLLNALIRQQENMSNQEITDFETEIKRLQRIMQLTEICRRYNISDKTTTSEITGLYLPLKDKLFGLKRYDVERDVEIKENLTRLVKKVSNELHVSEEELKSIVRAVGVQMGAWYKCPNGHPYAIGECGGAMQVSKCADCGADIGGTRHNLLSSNSHAGNIDNSRHAAWSEGANILNYRLDL